MYVKNKKRNKFIQKTKHRNLRYLEAEQSLPTWSQARIFAAIRGLLTK